MAKDTAWGASSGLPEGEFWIEDAEFGYKAEVGNGQRLLALLRGKLTDEDGDVTEQEYRFTVGEGWTRTNGGKTAVKDNGKEDATFNANTAWAKFFIAAIGLPGVEEVVRKRGTQRDINVWIGLGFEIAQVKSEFNDRNNPGQKVEYYTPTPVRFLGLKEGGAKPAAKSSKGSAAVEKAKAMAAKKEAEQAEDSSEGEDDLRSRLIELAKSSASHEDFVAAAFEIDGVDSGPLEEAVLDKDQLFAEANQ